MPAFRVDKFSAAKRYVLLRQRLELEYVYYSSDGNNFDMIDMLICTAGWAWIQCYAGTKLKVQI